LFDRSELRELIEQPGPGWRVSIYVPTVRAGDTTQNPIRLKNALREAEAGLTDRGLRRPEIDALLSAARERLDDHAFWEHQEDALAMFLADGFARDHRLPLEVEAFTWVGRRFHLKPLFALLGAGGRFHVLALSQKRVRLLEATPHSVRELEPEGMPHSLTEALGREVDGEHLQHHSVGRGQLGGEGAVWHGQGAGEEDVKVEIRKFFRHVDGALTAAIAGGAAPLVLAGVDYLLPLYREVSRHPRILDGGVYGNPDDLSAEALHAAALGVAAPVLQASRQVAIEAYREHAHGERATAVLDDIVRGAVEGRVATLLVAGDARVWGRFDSGHHRVELHETPGAESEDLLDRAAGEAWRTGADVFVLRREECPDGQPAAALMRY